MINIVLDLTVKSLLTFSVTQKASDLHLSSGEAPFMRQNGTLKRIASNILLASDLRTELHNLLNESQKIELEQKGVVDFAYNLPQIGRFRINVFYQNRGISATCRIINNNIPTLQDIHAPDIFTKLTKMDQGIILVTGSTGSGKSTTLAALLQHINTTESKHIITLEDPIEFIYKNEKSLIQQREFSKFSAAMNGLLRQDPDIVVLGELRNEAAILTALTIAETGHLVLATLHTNSAVKSINRIINCFESSKRDFIRSQLAYTLRTVICQKLVNDGNERKAIFEVLINTTAVSNLIHEGKIKQIISLIQTGHQYGMQLMPES